MNRSADPTTIDLSLSIVLHATSWSNMEMVMDWSE
jgi:hypothetical protein